MAEIEHFVDPKDKSHKKFKLVKDHVLPLYDKANQLLNNNLIDKTSTLEQAVNKGTIDNETLAYFMARTYEFLLSCGISAEGIRFRQHRDDEMAHYAKDCWDAEIYTSYGWIEVAGHADRSCYDLTKHSEKTKTELVAARQLEKQYT